MSLRPLFWAALWVSLSFGAPAWAQQVGSISGVVFDADFGSPLPEVQVTIAETGQKVQTDGQGLYSFGEVQPGTYTLTFMRDGYTQGVEPNVVVGGGELKAIEYRMSGEFVVMEQFLVQDIKFGAGTEIELLALRDDSAGLLDSIGADQISAAGLSDAGDALRLVTGASVQDDKAVIRGLPDRYVSSQVNGVRLPSADKETRAVELDQFPSDVIESVQVSKTFTPDQQGDASGGAVNIVTKRIPDGFVFKFGSSAKINTNARFRDDFLSYKDGGVNFVGDNNERRETLDEVTALDPSSDADNISVGSSERTTPSQHSWDMTIGGRHEFENGIVIGGSASIFYSTDVDFYDNGVQDSKGITQSDITPGRTDNPLVPDTSATTGSFDALTDLYDVTHASEEVQWGGLFNAGVEMEDHKFGVTYLFTRTAEDSVTLLEDTRGKEYFFPGHDPFDPNSPGAGGDAFTSPWHRSETLSYTERTNESLQFSGEHTAPFPESIGVERVFLILAPKFEWTVSRNRSSEDNPDRRVFSEAYTSAQAGTPAVPIDDFLADNGIFPGNPNYNLFRSIFDSNNDGLADGQEGTPDQPPAHWPLRTDSNAAAGNIQRIYENTDEHGRQYKLDFTIPFEQWTGTRGYVKVGFFHDTVERDFQQDTFQNLSVSEQPFLPGTDFDEFLSRAVDDGTVDLSNELFGGSSTDSSYFGEANTDAWYWMMDLPLVEWFSLIGGVRYERNEIAIRLDPEFGSLVLDPNVGELVFAFNNPLDPNSGRRLDLETGQPVGDADFRQEDALPSLGFVLTPTSMITIRGSYTETIARQTFREMSSSFQEEFFGGDVFIGNAELQSAGVENYDLRMDIEPYEGGLVSISWFRKDITNPIEYVSGFTNSTGTFTFPINFPEGQIKGWELEMRQSLGQIWRPLNGLSVGANATFLQSEVTLPESQRATFAGVDPALGVETRPATGAPEMIYNLNAVYEIPDTGTRFGVFYSVTGDTLIVGAGTDGATYIPDVYREKVGTLNATISQKIGKHIELSFKARNLTDPEIREVYRSAVTQDEVKRSYTSGIDLSFGVSAKFEF